MGSMRSLCGGLFLAGVFAVPASADIIIDDFSSVGNPDPWPVVVGTITTIHVSELGVSNVIGGSRASAVRATFLEHIGLDYVQAAILPHFGMILDYSSTAGARGDWNLRYDADGAGLNADFRSITDVVLEFGRFDFANGQPLPILVTLSDGQDQATLTRSLTAPGAQSVFFALADFAGIQDVDLAGLQSIEVFLDPGLAVDFRLSRVYGVPHPGSFSLLALGTLVFAGRRQRHDAVN